MRSQWDGPSHGRRNLSRKRNGALILDFDDWQSPLSHPRFNMAAVAEILRTAPDCRMHVIHRTVSTREALGHELKDWTRRLHRMPLLAVCGHGSSGFVNRGRRTGCPREVSLDWMESQLEGKAHGSVIAFGGCSVLRDIHGNRLRKFLRRTGAVAVAGYSTDVEYVPSSAWELLILKRLQIASLDRRGLERVALWIKLQARCPAFAALGFRIVCR